MIKRSKTPYLYPKRGFWSASILRDDLKGATDRQIAAWNKGMSVQHWFLVCHRSHFSSAQLRGFK